MILESCLDKIVIPLNVLICLLVRLIIPCLLPACGALTFPVAVNLKRFFAELLVFSFPIKMYRGYTKIAV
jgi:hypothetical protein